LRDCAAKERVGLVADRLLGRSDSRLSQILGDSLSGVQQLTIERNRTPTAMSVKSASTSALPDARAGALSLVGPRSPPLYFK
jgi:hypothetical protein